MDIIFNLESLERFSYITEEILKNLYISKEIANCPVDLKTIEIAKEDVRKLIFSSNLQLSKIAELLNNKGWEQAKVNIFLSTIEKRKTEIFYATVLNHNSTYGEMVTDFDWLLKFVCGTNDLKTLRYPLLQLILSTVNSSGEQKKTVYDINKEMLAKIIYVLENIQEVQ